MYDMCLLILVCCDLQRLRLPSASLPYPYTVLLTRLFPLPLSSPVDQCWRGGNHPEAGLHQQSSRLLGQAGVSK